jgi:hypothetical protein
MTIQEEAGTPESPATLALKIYNLLEPHPSEMRQRAVRSALMSLGEVSNEPAPAVQTAMDSRAHVDDAPSHKFGPRATKLMNRHGITTAMIDEVFHVSDGGKVDIIASSVPGAAKREMTENCYLLSGLRSLLATDTPSFDDGYAIAMCKHKAAYDKNNHTTYRSAIGNKIAGTRPNLS